MRPPILCKLKKGKLIDADDNKGFVDTFNWMVDFINNLCGDGDLDKGKLITLDRTIDDRPVIRGGGGMVLKCGDDSNIVFTPDTDGKIKVDVYYV